MIQHGEFEARRMNPKTGQQRTIGRGNSLVIRQDHVILPGKY